jgi:hypothetical protein
MAINYISAQAANVSSLTTVYQPTTTSSVQATLIGCLLANTNNVSTTASVTLTNNSGITTTYIINNVIIPAGNSLDILNAARIVVPYNYAVKVTATLKVDVTISSIEVT